MSKTSPSDREAALEELAIAIAEGTVDAWLEMTAGDLSDEDSVQISRRSEPVKKNPAEAAVAIAQHHRVPSNPVLFALGWMPPQHLQLTELDRTVLRLVAEMARCSRRTDPFH